MYDNSKQLMNDFMGGYRDDQYSNVEGISVFASLQQKLARYKGNGKDVRLFQYCYTDSSFKKGWYDVITPNKNKTLRLGLGKKGTTKDDDMSAIYIPSGYDVVLHEHRRSSPNFSKGKHKIIRKSTKCLASIGWNDIVSEIDIIPQKSGFLGNITGHLAPWQTQVGRNPVQTLGTYGGSNSGWGSKFNIGNIVGNLPKPEMCYNCIKPSLGQNSPVRKAMKIKGCDETTWFKKRSDACPQHTTHTPVVGVVPNIGDATIGATPNVTPVTSYTPASPPSAPRPVTPQASKYDILEVTDAPVTMSAKEEEKSMWKNPLVWGAIALVVIGGAYMMTRGKKGKMMGAPVRVPRGRVRGKR